MRSTTQARATLDDLLRVEGKAELIAGRIVHFMASGDLPGEVALKIVFSLWNHCQQTGLGIARGDNVGYAVEELSSGRESFSPDASYHLGPRPANPMRFIDGAPTFAVEVRSEHDSGAAAELAMAAKRADYFEAGTRAVWDVDPVRELVHVHRADIPLSPTTYGRGDEAEAEPAVVGWRLAVDRIFG